MRYLFARALTGAALLASPAVAQMTSPVDPSTYSALQWRSIGPVQMGGRVTDVEGIPSPSKTFYIAAAAGGVWKTVNNGVTFFPVWTGDRVISMGDMAIAPSDTNQVWLGTGEEDSRNSISPGGGIYKSTDGGVTWKSMGLNNTETIGRIVVHPRNPNIVWVAALGAIWKDNEDRGLYKTTDGGNTWRKVKHISAKAGFVDVAVHPNNPDILFAASWERRRGPHFLQSGGPGSGLWKSTNGGETWTEVTGGGFPATMKGRIGIAMSRSNPDVIYTMVEAARPTNSRDIPSGAILDTSGNYEGRLNGLYRSADGGRTWTWMNRQNDRPFYYSQIRVDPTNPNRVYRLGGTNWHVSEDGGRSWRSGAGGIHVDHHAMWIDPNDPNRFVLGEDGGAAITFDRGGTYDVLNYIPLGQFYAISYDFALPYRVCGGLQDNGSWCGPSRKRGGILASDWFNVGGGDGFWTAQDPTDPNVIYSESQGGSMSARNIFAGEQWSTRPGGGRGGAAGPFGQLRWNWNTPFLLSNHNPKVYYTAANRVFKSMNQGRNPFPISGDLTNANADRIRISTGRNPDGSTAADRTGGITPDATGAETNGTIVSLSESPIKAGILFTGSDDGKVFMTKNDGQTWTDLSTKFAGVPPMTWVSHVEASAFDTNTVYVAFDNHWEGDFKPYVFVSTDGANTFRSISSNLPADRPGHVHVVREDPVNRNLLYVGTDVGIYVSLNGGGSWSPFMQGLANAVPVHDLKVHPRDRELIAGTHGRSIWIADVAPLQQMTNATQQSPAHLFEPAIGYMYNTLPAGPGVGGHRGWRGDGGPNGVQLVYNLSRPAATAPRIVITDAAGDTVAAMPGTNNVGLNTVSWNFTRGEGGAGGGRGFGGGGGGGRGAANVDPDRTFPGFPPGYNPRPGEGARADSLQGHPRIAAAPGAGGRGGGGGGGRGGFPGAAPARAGWSNADVDSGRYLATLIAGDARSRTTITVKNVGSVLPTQSVDYFGQPIR